MERHPRRRARDFAKLRDKTVIAMGESSCGMSGKGRRVLPRRRREREPEVPSLSVQITLLFVIAIPVACVAWTVTHEEVFREPREYCVDRSKSCGRWYQRKFFYLFTCEYCFSHYVTALFLFVTRYKLLYEDWRGYLLALFALVWVANQYMSLYNRLRLDIKSEKIETEIKANVAEKVKHEPLTVAVTSKDESSFRHG
jgi:hypothetical protein